MTNRYVASFIVTYLWWSPSILGIRRSETLKCRIQTVVFSGDSSDGKWFWRNVQGPTAIGTSILWSCSCSIKFPTRMRIMCRNYMVEGFEPKKTSRTSRYMEMVQTNQWCNLGLSGNREPSNIIIFLYKIAITWVYTTFSETTTSYCPWLAILCIPHSSWHPSIYPHHKNGWFDPYP